MLNSQASAGFYFTSIGPILDDQVVLDAAKSVYSERVAESEPLLMIVETYGPHGSSALLSSNCTESGRPELAPDLSSAITCTLRNTDTFLEHTVANHGDRPTVILLVSDHLNHDTFIQSRVPLEERANTVIMYTVGADQPFVLPGTMIDRPASMMDVYPTLLAYLGFADRGNAVGLGRSLFGDTLTFLEQKGFDRFNAELFPNPLLNDMIWASGDEALAAQNVDP